MNPGTYFKLRCLACDVSVVIGVRSSSETLRCSRCGGPLVPDGEAQSVVDNLDCPSCHVSFALIASDTCPMCGEPFSTVQ